MFFFICWLKGAFLGLTFALFSGVFYSFTWAIISCLLMALSLFLNSNPIKNLLIVCSGFLWTSSFNSPQVERKPKNQTIGSHIKNQTQAWILKKIQVHKKISPWLQSLILGKRASLSKETKDSFSSLGIFHLLVLSGLHIGFFVFALFGFLYSHLLISYSFCLINCGRFFVIQEAIRIFVCFALFFYGYLVNFSSSVQRASIFATVQLLQPFLPYTFTMGSRLLLILLLQILFFPADFLSLSTFLSWGSMLLILELSQNKSTGQILKTQALLAILVAATCGKLSLIGILLNLILVPLFSFTYILALFPLMDLILPPFMVSLAVEFQGIFLNFITSLAILPKVFPWLYIDLLEHHYLIRFLFLLGLSYYFTILVHRFQAS